MFSFTSASTLVVLLLSLSGTSASDVCLDAVDVTSFPFSTTGDLADATPDFANPTDNLGNFTCGISPTSPGVWYAITPSSDMFVKATVTPDAETMFITALFQGSCDDLDCVEPRSYGLENQRTQPALTWFAKSNMAYYLHVAGINPEEVGSFTVDVQEVSMERPSNDQCSAAQAIDAATPITSDSTGAQPHGLDVADCSLHPDSRGTFFELKGTGNKMTVTYQTDMPEENRMEVAVLTGDSCNRCVTMSEFLTAVDTPHSVSFDSFKGQMYQIVVSGERFSDAGEFQLEVEEGEAAPFSSAGNGFEVTPGDLQQGSLEGSGTGRMISSFGAVLGLMAMALIF